MNGCKRRKPLVVLLLISIGMAPSLTAPGSLAAQTGGAPFAVDYAEARGNLVSLLDFQFPFEPVPAAPAERSPQPAPAERPTQPAPAGPAPQSAASTGGPYSLPDLEALALRSSPLIRSAQAGRLAAEADLRSAKAQRLPVFALDTSASFLGNPLGPITIKKGEFGSVANPQDPSGSTILLPPRDTTLYKGMEPSLYQFKLSADFPLFTWGKINTGIEAALAALSAARIKESQTVHELRYKLQGTWEALAFVVQTEKILELQLRAGNRLLELARQSYASGFSTRSELLAAEVKIKEIEIGKAMVAEKRNRLLSDLVYLTGLKDLSLKDLAFAPSAAGSPRLTQREALEELPRKNLNLAYGRAMLEAQKRMQSLAEIHSWGLPDIGLHLEASYGGSRFPFFETDWYGKDDYQFTLSLGTKGSLFGNPVKAGEALKAKARTEDAIAQLAQGEQNLASFIREQYLTLELQKNRLEYAQLKLSAQAEELERQKQLLSSGSGAESEYLSKLLESLSTLTDAYSQLALYRSTLLSLEAAGAE